MEAAVSDNLLTQTLPSEYIPGGDRLSRMILKNQKVVDLVSHNLMDTSSGSYMIGDTDWNSTRSDILYIPAKASLTSLPPLLIEVQNTIDAPFLQRLISYSLNVVKVYKTLPVVLVIGINKISPSSMLLEFNSSSPDKPWLFNIPCTIWAKHCYLVSKETIGDQNRDTTVNPLLALFLFLTEQQQSLYLHTHPHDPTIIQLYQIAFSLVSPDYTYEENYAKAAETICDTNEKLFKRALDKISTGMDVDRIKRICERGIEYNREIKYRLQDNETSSQELDFPHRLPLGPSSKKKIQKHTMSDQDFKFAQDFKSKSVGRMNWKMCLQAGQNKGLLTSYRTSESLRVSYSSRHF
ncbi:unnamed protein product [Rhizopus microsporus]|uniref:Uncharacterized protein n=1 Tax=Rhizopus microsporus TaxID=58291 RepID=A0A1X0RJT3_RHIZD|nr:hypothetical protein BCV71DRAFT_230460 [Rhizopus microsporus]